jgi:protein-tyrosine phosphatase
MNASVLFVCLGNICRSPLAEAALKREAEQLDFRLRIDSAGTGDWHVGRAPDPRAVAAAARNGIDISGLQARQVSLADFYEFTHIVALDAQNLADLKAIQPADATAELSLLLDHVDGRQGEAVADPYYGEAEHFDRTWRDVAQGARGLARRIAGRP